MQLRTFFLPISVAAMAATFTQANAQDFYFEGAVGAIDETAYNLTTSNLDTNLAGARIGWEVTPYFAVEGEYFAGLNEHNEIAGVRMSEGELVTATRKQSVSSTYGVYGKVSLPIGESFKLFTRVGFANIKTDGESRLNVENSTPFEFSTNRDDIAVGIGASYDLTDRIYARVDATSHDLSQETNSVTIGAGIRF